MYFYKIFLYFIQIKTDNEAVIKWSKILQKTPESYLQQLIKALSDFTENKNDNNKFELEGDKLIWKKFYSDKEMFGKIGKFSLTEVC